MKRITILLLALFLTFPSLNYAGQKVTGDLDVRNGNILESTNTAAITVNTVLGSTAALSKDVQILTPNADLDVTLTAVASSTGKKFRIFNGAADGSGFDLSIKTSTGTLVATAAPQEWVEVSCDGSNWFFDQGIVTDSSGNRTIGGAVSIGTTGQVKYVTSLAELTAAIADSSISYIRGVSNETWTVSSRITIARSNLTIDGDFTLRAANSLNDHILYAFGQSGLVFRNFKIDGNKANQSSVDVSGFSGIYLDSCTSPVLENLTVDSVYGGRTDAKTASSIRNASYKWTASGSGTNEYYLEAAPGGDPGLEWVPAHVLENGSNIRYYVPDSGAALGNLAASRWGYGDNDSLGFNTIYIRLADGTDPDTKAEDYVQTRIMYPMNGGLHLRDCTNAVIKSCSVSNTLYGNLVMAGGSGHEVMGGVYTLPGETNITTYNCSDVRIIGVEATYSGRTNGGSYISNIAINGKFNKVVGCTIKYSGGQGSTTTGTGIVFGHDNAFADASGSKASGNTIYDSTAQGVRVGDSTSTTLSVSAGNVQVVENTIRKFSLQGVWIYNTGSDSVISLNTFWGEAISGQVGVYSSGGIQTVIANNTLRSISGTGKGILLDGANIQVLVANNSFRDVENSGIEINHASTVGSRIVGNRFYAMSRPINVTAAINSTNKFLDNIRSDGASLIYTNSGGEALMVDGNGMIEKTVSITANHTITIPVQIPSGVRILSVQLRVDTALAAGETWNAQYATGATQSIASVQAVAKDTKVTTYFDANAATDITSDVTDITIQRSSNPGVDAFTAQGVIRARVWYEVNDALPNA